MTDSTYFVKSTPDRAFTDPYNTLQICTRHAEDMHEKV